MNREKRLGNLDMLGEFKLIKKEFKRIRSMATNETDDSIYWTHYEIVKKMLGDFLEKYKFIDLPKNDFLLLVSMCSSLRPVEPFRFMSAVSHYVEDSQ